MEKRNIIHLTTLREITAKLRSPEGLSLGTGSRPLRA